MSEKTYISIKDGHYKKGQIVTLREDELVNPEYLQLLSDKSDEWIDFTFMDAGLEHTHKWIKTQEDTNKMMILLKGLILKHQPKTIGCVDKEYIVSIVWQKQQGNGIENKLRSYKVQALNSEMALGLAINEGKKGFSNYVIAMFDVNEIH